MKRLLLAVLVLGSGQAPLQAAAPATFTAGVFRSFSREQWVVNHTEEIRRFYVLRSDGTLWSLFSSAAANDARATAAPRWSYQRNAEDSATLRVGEWSYAVTFENNTSGQYRIGDVVRATCHLEPACPATTLANLSSLAFVRPGGTALCGFVTKSPHTYALVRAIGPGLRSLGRSQALASPRLWVSRSPEGSGAPRDAEVIVSSDEAPPPTRPLTLRLPSTNEILASLAAYTGAFPLQTGDAAAFVALEPGAHLVTVDSAGPADTGDVLIEVYFIGL